VCASIGPDTFAEFSIPYNNRILQGFRGGRLHNCGPNPSARLYPNHEAETLGLNCSYRYSRADLKKLKSSFSGRGVIEFNFDNGESAEEIVRGFEEIARGLSPDAIGMPVLFLDHSWSDEDLRGVYADLRGISERYAREICWQA